MKYYISDLHLFHENSIRFDNRPFKNITEMHETIRERWNRKITNGDTVYILGDVCRHLQNHKPRAINVGCMKPWMDYEPRSLSEILNKSF